MSDFKPSVDPVAILLQPGDRSPVDNKAMAAGLVGLEYLARQAFEEKRRKQCLEVTGAILKIQPEHEEARTIQASVRSDLDRDFASAQEIVCDARLKCDPILYSRATAILRKIVEADPDNLEAQSLLHETVAFSYFCPSPPTGRAAWIWKWIGRRTLILIGSIAAVVLVAMLALMNGTASQVSAQMPAKPAVVSTTEPARNTPQLDRFDYPRVETASAVFRPVRNETVAAPAPASAPARILPAAPPAKAPILPALPADVAAPIMGALAVNAAVPAEIYRGEVHLGSTPTTLQLPAGPQTLEYRYQGLRQSVTHMIAGQETTAATITFSIKVQINAKPWAQVFIDGARSTPIGQTPLGDVSVSVGSVLVFQNPGFPEKRYRVTAKDAAIQISFP